jgi:hypothetical protein
MILLLVELLIAFLIGYWATKDASSPWPVRVERF